MPSGNLCTKGNADNKSISAIQCDKGSLLRGDEIRCEEKGEERGKPWPVVRYLMSFGKEVGLYPGGSRGMLESVRQRGCGGFGNHCDWCLNMYYTMSRSGNSK